MRKSFLLIGKQDYNFGLQMYFFFFLGLNILENFGTSKESHTNFDINKLNQFIEFSLPRERILLNHLLEQMSSDFIVIELKFVIFLNMIQQKWGNYCFNTQFFVFMLYFSFCKFKNLMLQIQFEIFNLQNEKYNIYIVSVLSVNKSIPTCYKLIVDDLLSPF